MPVLHQLESRGAAYRPVVIGIKTSRSVALHSLCQSQSFSRPTIAAVLTAATLAGAEAVTLKLSHDKALGRAAHGMDHAVKRQDLHTNLTLSR
jgi:hypothetical protein